jgi:oxalate decarboxylase/phosphoglucose isomerase-like protein (cupin superfamily)
MSIRDSLNPTPRNVSIEAQHFEHITPVIFGDYHVRCYSVADGSARSTNISCGVTILPAHKRSNINGITGRLADSSFERIAVLAKGSMLVHWNGTDHWTEKMEQYSCVYLPSEQTCIIENLGNEDAVLAWTSSNSAISQESKADSIKIVRPFEEIEPVVLSIKGFQRLIYRIKQTKNFHFAIFRRGANTYSPLHTHDPSDFEEAFIVLDGKLWVTDLNGQTSLLNGLDYAYVPPFGGNLNENRSGQEVKYLWIGFPPVNMKEKPVDSEFSKFEDQMSLEKAK